MELEDLYSLSIWKKLSKNSKFEEEFKKVLNECNYEKNKDDIEIVRIGDSIHVSYVSQIHDHEYDCQYKEEEEYVFSLDKDENLVVSAKHGSLRSDYGYSFENTNGGLLSTSYVCKVYDPDGIELDYQLYNDSHRINRNVFVEYADRMLGVLEFEYNPKLEEFHDSYGELPKAESIGDGARYLRKSRSKDELGIVKSISCHYTKDGMVEDLKEEYFFNTFYARESEVEPERISFMYGNPFATLDQKKSLQISDTFRRLGLTSDNYQEVARERFLKELLEEKKQEKRNDKVSKYDTMIKKIEEEMMKKERTR